MTPHIRFSNRSFRNPGGPFTCILAISYVISTLNPSGSVTNAIYGLILVLVTSIPLHHHQCGVHEHTTSNRYHMFPHRVCELSIHSRYTSETISDLPSVQRSSSSTQWRFSPPTTTSPGGHCHTEEYISLTFGVTVPPGT